LHISEVYKRVTEQIIRDLEAGTPVWIKPWKTEGGGIMPFNFATKRTYNGINVPILWQQASSMGYASQGWLTYKQAQAMGAQVRKGERGTIVVFTKKLRVGEEDDPKLISMLRTFVVFNVSQMDGLTVPEEKPREEPEVRYAHADGFVRATGAAINHGEDKACFIPSRDMILMPHRASFSGEEHYHATLLHECVHWSGHEKRLNRDLKNRFGTEAYAAEELIAELGAAFLCAHLGIEGELRHAGYIQSWIKILKEDQRAIFTAASKASRAADYLRAFSDASEQADEAA
jgi:antirestriction protein ArdC